MLWFPLSEATLRLELQFRGLQIHLSKKKGSHQRNLGKTLRLELQFRELQFTNAPHLRNSLENLRTMHHIGAIQQASLVVGWWIQNLLPCRHSRQLASLSLQMLVIPLMASNEAIHLVRRQLVVLQRMHSWASLAVISDEVLHHWNSQDRQTRETCIVDTCSCTCCRLGVVEIA